MSLDRLRKPQHVLLICLLFWHSTATLATNCCNDGETKEDLNDCLSYYVCCSGVFVHKSCASGDYWDSSSATCQLNNSQCCPGAGTCTDNQIQVDPQDCAAYFICFKGQFVSQKCPSGTYFDTTIKACVIDTEGYCPS